MTDLTCLNCAENYTGHFCPNCGQKASTRRFDFKQLLSWDFLSENLNFDRGLFLTARDLLLRPGYMVNDYLAGKRKKYFNFVGFLLILLGLEAILYSTARVSAVDAMYNQISGQLKASGASFAEALQREDVESVLLSQKFIFLLVIPITAVFVRLVLKRMQYHVMEHCVAITFLLAMNTLLGLLVGLLGYLPISVESFGLIYMVFSIAIIGLNLSLIWQYTLATNYSFMGRTWRMLLSYAIIMLLLSASLQLAIGIKVGMRGAKAAATPIESTE